MKHDLHTRIAGALRLLSFLAVSSIILAGAYAQELAPEQAASSITNPKSGSQTPQVIPLDICKFTIGIISAPPCPPDPLPIAPQDGPPAPIECCCYQLTFTSLGPPAICKLELTFIDVDPICDMCEEPPGWHWETQNGQTKLVCHDPTKSLKPGHPITTKICGSNTSPFISSTFKAYDCNGNLLCEKNSNVTPAGENCPEGEPVGAVQPSYSPQIEGVLRVSTPFPNPSDKSVNFSYFQWHSGPIAVTVFDAQGKTISKFNSLNTGGAEYQFKLDVSPLGNGSYLAEFKVGAYTLLRKFQVNR